MKRENLITVMEILLRDGFKEQEIINAVRSISAKLALERWNEMMIKK